MIGLVALDLVLRIVLARMMDIAFVVRVPRVYPYDAAADPTSFGIPGYVVADFECPCHELMLFHPMRRESIFRRLTVWNSCAVTKLRSFRNINPQKPTPVATIERVGPG